MSEETCLYRAYDRGGVLLYVGISLTLIGRLTAHRAASAWFKDLSHLTVERYATRDKALVAERKAIERETPLHNRTWNRPHSAKRYEYGEQVPLEPTRFQVKLQSIRPNRSGRLKKVAPPPRDVGKARGTVLSKGLDPNLFTDAECLKIAGVT